MGRPNDARWVHDILDHGHAHLARPRAPLTVCGAPVGADWQDQPQSAHKKPCGCIVTDLAERGEIVLRGPRHGSPSIPTDQRI